MVRVPEPVPIESVEARARQRMLEPDLARPGTGLRLKETDAAEFRTY